MKILWSPRARRNLDAIFTDILEGNPTAAISVLDAIELRVSQLSKHPDLGWPGMIAGTRELVVNTTPYVIAYQLCEEPRQIEILAIVHGARLWPERFE